MGKGRPETSDEPRGLYPVVNCAYGSQLHFVAVLGPTTR